MAGRAQSRARRDGQGAIRVRCSGFRRWISRSKRELLCSRRSSSPRTYASFCLAGSFGSAKKHPETFTSNKQPCAGRGPSCLVCNLYRRGGRDNSSKSGKPNPEVSVDWGALIKPGRGGFFDVSKFYFSDPVCLKPTRAVCLCQRALLRSPYRSSKNQIPDTPIRSILSLSPSVCLMPDASL